jgi:1-acyl-sn-glycerol-3-phosphate acyltransferase
LVLQKIFYRKIPFLKFFLKNELIWFPVLGQAWWALDFPFMKRYSVSDLKKNPGLKGKDLEITQKACKKFKAIPTSIMNFVEGTRFTDKKHVQQKSPFKNLLRPKAGGLAFAIASIGDKMRCLLDVSIVYPNGKKSFWDFICGHTEEIRVKVKSYPIDTELIGNYSNDRAFRKYFHKWLNDIWEEKDLCIHEMKTAADDAAANRSTRI